MDRSVLLAHIRRTHFAPGDVEKARSDARKIADFLRSCATGRKNGVDGRRIRVFGIGSAFASYRRFRQDSDIDLLVEGIPPAEFFAATAKAAELSSFPVDIIPMESARPEFLELVWSEAVEL